MKNKKVIVSSILLFLAYFTFPVYGDDAFSLEDRAKMGEVYSLERLKRYDEVKPMIADLYKRYPNNKEVKWTYARIWGFGGDWKAAQTIFDELCAKECDPEMVLTYGHILESQGPKPETLLYIKKLVTQHPDQKELQPIYAEILSWNTQDPKGRDAIGDLNAQFPDDPQIIEALGDIAYASKDFAHAQEYYEKISGKEASPGIRKKYIDALLGEKKYTEAISQMDTLLSAAPNDQDLRYQHAQVIAATGKHEQAVKELKSLMQEGFNKKEAMVMLGDELRQLGHDDEALKIYKEVNNNEKK